MSVDDEEGLLRSVAMQNASTILAARQRADHDLRQTNEALEQKTRDLEASEAELREEKRILELLNQAGTQIASQLDLRALVQSATDIATQMTGAAFGAFFYKASVGGDSALMLYTLSGAPAEAFDRFGHPRATALFGPTFRGEAPIRSGDILTDPRYGKMGPHHGMPQGHLPVRSYLAVPVVSRIGEVIGGLFFGHPEPDVFTEPVERAVVTLAAHVAVAIDNARLYEAERGARVDLERISMLKDEFLATLSHELRTPLSAILGWAEALLSDRHGLADNVRRGLEVISRNAGAQAQLINDLLDMSAIISGKLRLEVGPTELPLVVDAAVESIRPAAAAKGVRIRKILDSAPTVHGDAHRLQQVLWNLLSNALKFTPKGGKIEVILTRVDSSVELTVADSGIGITADFLPHVFDRFRQADGTSTRHHGGLGLGLSIVKQLVELHGGTVRAQSDGPGCGATFTVSLPLGVIRPTQQEHATTARVLVTAAEPGRFDLTGVTVLIVDDEPDARDLIKWILSSCHAEVVVAESAADALRRIDEGTPDVIISDIGMPDLDGYHFIREVRRRDHASGGRTPAIALTAFARSEDRTRALLAGFQAHLAKPLQPGELIATVASLLGKTGLETSAG